jgi:hypothetical protein
MALLIGLELSLWWLMASVLRQLSRQVHPVVGQPAVEASPAAATTVSARPRTAGATS